MYKEELQIEAQKQNSLDTLTYCADVIKDRNRSLATIS